MLTRRETLLFRIKDVVVRISHFHESITVAQSTSKITRRNCTSSKQRAKAGMISTANANIAKKDRFDTGVLETRTNSSQAGDYFSSLQPTTWRSRRPKGSSQLHETELIGTNEIIPRKHHHRSGSPTRGQPKSGCRGERKWRWRRRWRR